MTTPSYVNDPTLTGSIYDIASINVITEYSDLEYTQTEVSLGGAYRFSPTLFANAQAAMQIFADNSPYVYGDQDGTAYTTNVGIGYKF